MISVIVPIYNVEQYLKKCIESIISSTYANLEIILVDDGSTDGSGKICDEFQAKDKRIRVVHKKNGGLSDARNVGLEIARGEFVSFIDSDDYIDSEMFEEVLTQFDKNTDIVIYGRYVEYPTKTIVQCPPSNKSMTNIEGIIELSSFKGFDMAAWDKIYRKNIIGKLRFPYGKKNEDYFFTYKLFDKAKAIKTINRPFYHYVQRQDSISRGKKIPFDAIEGSKEEVDYIKNHHPEIINVAYTNLFFSYVSVYNISLKQKIKLNLNQIKDFKKSCKKIQKWVYENNHISILKKLQAYVFCHNLIIYNILFKFKIRIK